MELTIWTDGLRAATVAAILEHMGPAVTPIGVGGPPPEAAGAVDGLAGTLACGRWDDLRKLIVEHPPKLLLLATMRSVDPSDLLAATAQGATVLTLEPPAADLRDLQRLTGSKPHAKLRLIGRDRIEAADSGAASPTSAAGSTATRAPARIIHLPDFRQSPAFLETAELFDAIGEHRLVSYRSVGPAACGSLFARLFDGWRTVLRFVDQPESVAASLIGPGLVPDGLGELTGAMAAQGRMADGSAAVLQVADHAGRSERALRIIGDRGELRISDGGYSVWRLDGAVLDADESGQAMDDPELVAHQWRRLLDRPAGLATAADESMHVDAQALACCLACLLSARTGQTERPGQVLQMSR